MIFGELIIDFSSTDITFDRLDVFWDNKEIYNTRITISTGKYYSLFGEKYNRGKEIKERLVMKHQPIKGKQKLTYKEITGQNY